MVRLYLDRIDAHERRHRSPGCPHRGRDPTLSTRPGPAGEHPGLVTSHRRCVHRRDRCGHERVPHRRAPGVLGRCARRAATNQPAGSNRQKPCPATATSKPPSGWPPCQRRAAPDTYFGARFRRIAGAPTSPTRNQEVAPLVRRRADRRRCARTQDAHLRLAHAGQRHVLPRPRPRLLHPTPPRENQSQSHQTTPSPRIQRHTRTPHRSRLTPVHSPLTSSWSP